MKLIKIIRLKWKMYKAWSESRYILSIIEMCNDAAEVNYLHSEYSKNLDIIEDNENKIKLL